MATTMTAGTMVTRRRAQSGMRNRTKSCMMVWPAIVPTTELDSPDASSEVMNTAAAPMPSSGTRV